MKDAVWNIRILTYLSLILIAVMTIGKTAYSWSQNHTYHFDFLLYGVLGSILTIFTIRSFTHPEKDEKLFKVIWTVRNRHMNRIVAYLFFGVLVFGVNSEFDWVSKLHEIFTASAILAVYINMVWYYKARKARIGAIIWALSGIGGFCIGYFSNDVTIAEGEAFAAFPNMLWILSTTKIE